MLSRTQILVSAAPARISGSPPRATPTRRFARASSGITTTELVSRTSPMVEELGSSRSIRLRMPSTTTYAARMKKVTATAFSARRSLTSSASPCRSRAASRRPTRTAAIDSMPESTPNPKGETSPASSPAVIATLPSATL